MLRQNPSSSRGTGTAAAPVPRSVPETASTTTTTANSGLSLPGAGRQRPVPDREPVAVDAEPDPRDNTIDPWDLPADLRREFPDIEISVHVYAPDPASRFVLIDGERYGERETVADGVRLAEIHRGGVIVEFRDYRIWIE